jgi:hypothetical protein
MKLTKQDVCVFIENEQQLQEAQEMLERYGEVIDYPDFFRVNDGSFNFLKCDKQSIWYLGTSSPAIRTEITLPELEQILKEEHDK